MNPEISQCTGKQAYPTKPAAMKVLKRMKDQRRIRDRSFRPPMDVYRCDYCHSYHIGRRKL